MAATKEIEQELFGFHIEDMFKDLHNVVEEQIKEATAIIEREFNKNKFFTPEINQETLQKVEESTRKTLLTNLDRLEMHSRANFFCSQDMIEYSRVKKKNETVQKQRLDELEQQIGSTLQTLERGYQDKLRTEFKSLLQERLKQTLDQSEDACIERIQQKCAQQSQIIGNYDKLIRQASEALDRIENSTTSQLNQ